jgi:hypothetical protein
LGERLYVADSEKAPDYLPKLKTGIPYSINVNLAVVEVLLDIFLRSFIAALIGQRDVVSPHGAVTSFAMLDPFFAPAGRCNTEFWDCSLFMAQVAQGTLRRSNITRLVEPEAAELLATQGLEQLNERFSLHPSGMPLVIMSLVIIPPTAATSLATFANSFVAIDLGLCQMVRHASDATSISTVHGCGNLSTVNLKRRGPSLLPDGGVPVCEAGDLQTPHHTWRLTSVV